MRRAITLLALLVGCADQADSPDFSTSTVDQDATVCGSGPTVKGVDVSYYQGTIDWGKAKAAGVQYAIIRVSDGANYNDTKFALNWANSRAAGVLHGAYQFFRPGQDVIAQADLLLSKMGPLQPDDLPPTLDVEASDGYSAASVGAKVKQWMTYVQGKIGRSPIIYTGKYFWQDNVGGLNLSSAPLWHAQYTSASCPNIADQWSSWLMWQYSSSGSVNGIPGAVDMDRFNGTMADLLAFIGPVAPCGTIAADGGMVDDGDKCFTGGGPATYLRAVTGAGQGNDLIWTHTTSSAAEANFATWDLNFAESGTYKVEVYTAHAYAKSKKAKYVITGGGAKHSVVLDQSAADGWQTLGNVSFAAGGSQSVHLGDNTGEPGAGNVQLVFDAVRVTRVTGAGASVLPTDGDDTGDDGADTTAEGGCTTGGSGAGGLLIGLAAVVAGMGRRRGQRAQD